MSDRLRLSLLAAGAFLIALVAGVLVADALSSEDTAASLPEAIGEPIPLLSGVPEAGQPPVEEVLRTEPYRQVEVDAEYVALDFGEDVEGGFGAIEDAPGSGGDPGFGDGAGETPGSDGDGTGAAPVSEDPGFVEERRLDIPFLDLLSPDVIFRFLRFIDPCALTPEDPGCPPGAGGTILGTLDEGPLSLAGPFQLSRELYPVSSDFSRCPDTGPLRSNEYALMILATHPARIDVSYYPNADPSDVDTVTVDVSYSTHREFTRFVETLERNGGPVSASDRVQHCFVIDGGRVARTIVIEAEATSFTGETDSETYSFRTFERRNRPPITVAPLNDYEVNIAVPMPGDGMHTTKVRAIHHSVDLTCTDIELGVLSGEIPDMVIGPGDPPASGYLARDPIGDIIESPDWRYDPAYDHYDFWNLQLEEGSGYQLCVWWIRSPARSFDSATIIDRETRWISTPDVFRARIRVVGVVAPSTGPVPAESILIAGPCGSARVPSVDLDRDGGVTVQTGSLPLCDYAGFQQPAITPLRVTGRGASVEVAIPTPNSGDSVLWRSRVTIDLTEESTSGLCGGSFGSCDPPTSEYPRARIILEVDFYDGRTSRHDDWSTGAPFGFDAAEVEPAGLPEEIQIDYFGSGVEADPAEGRHALKVTAEFDRPVTLQAQLQGGSAVPEYCLEGDSPTFATDVLATRHGFSLTGLCTLSGYYVELIATDADGGVRVFRDARTSPEYSWWPAYGVTDGYDVSYFLDSVWPGVAAVHVGHFYVTVAGGPLSGVERVDLVAPDRCLKGRRSAIIPAIWGETIAVTVSVSLALDGRTDADRTRTGSCPSPDTRYSPRVEFEGSVETSFTIEDFMAGPVTVFVPLIQITSGSPSNLPPLTVVIGGG